MRMIGLSRRDAQERAVDLLGSVGMEGHAESYPDDLCGGQQQRVAIVQTLAVQPRVMLSDETTAVLHPELVGEVLEMVRELAHGGPTMPLATHAMGFARDVATHVCLLDNGCVLERGSAETDPLEPREERTQQLLSRVGQVRAPVTRHLSVPSWHVT